MKELRSHYIYLRLSILCASLLILTTSLAQQVRVVDSEDLPLVGVQIFTENRSFSSISDTDGFFRLDDRLVDTVSLVFRYLGYEEYRSSVNEIRAASYIVHLKPKELLITEVFVLGRRNVAKQEIPYQIATIKASDIASTQAQTSADALAQHGGVYVQKSQMGGGSPLIRGFEANRVLLVVDGVRLNNAIYRSGHLQSAITVDQAILEKMDVIFGPNSLLFGSDALGGVVHFKTRTPKLSSDGVTTKVGYYIRHATANNEKSIHADISLSGKKISSLSSITYADFGDLRAGNNRDDRFPAFGKRSVYQDRVNGEDVQRTNDDPNIQVGTGYNQMDILQKILFVPHKDHRLTANVHYSTSTDIPRYDNLSERQGDNFRWAEWYYGPQNRLLASIDYRLLLPTPIWDDLAVIGAYQRIDEDRVERPWQFEQRTFQEEDVSVWSVTVDASKYLKSNKQLRLQYGLDLQTNEALSTAYNEDVNSGVVSSNQLTRYASSVNDYTTAGVYLSLNGATSQDRLKYNAGLRYTQNNFFLKYDRNDPVDWPEDFYTGRAGANNALTWSVGGTWLGQDGWNIRSIVSTAFRSPNIDDLSKVRVNSQEITFPNLDLGPEQSINAELTLARKFDSGLDLSLTGFYTRLRDAIINKPGLAPDGQSTWVSRGDTLLVTNNINAENARIMGLSINASYGITSKIQATSSLNYTNGREPLDDGTTAPFAHIPPVYGQVGLAYSNHPWTAKIVYRYNGFKSLEDFGGAVDNPDLATPIGSLAWSTLDVYSSYAISDKISISLAMENILDKHYRPFGSGVSAAGRNVIVGVRGAF